jgi:hypothetical protein
MNSDFKSRASGEKDDVLLQPDEDAWPVEDLESDNAPPTFENESWPSEQDAPEDPPEPDPGGEVDLDPQRECRAAVQELGKTTGRAIIDGKADPKPQAPVPAVRKKLPPLPSDRGWLPTMRKILGAGGK